MVVFFHLFFLPSNKHVYVRFPQCKYHHQYHLSIYFMSFFYFYFYLNQHFVSKVSYLVTNLNSDHEKVKL